MENFVKYCLMHGGTIQPLLIDSNIASHTGICNPSIFVDNCIKRLILRNVNYTLWNCDNEYRFVSPYGPVCYITPYDDLNLRTDNFLCEVNGDGTLSANKIDMKLDKQPKWEFIGLEDARLIRWDRKLYITGVRRDTSTNGQGRMELSEITDDGVEISRVRIKAPNDDSSYCEKNWMPILDWPYHYVKWCNPLEIVEVNPITGESKVVISKEIDAKTENLNPNGMDIRGSSQVIDYKGYHIAITHLCTLWINEKSQKSGSGYFHQFIVWDNDWNIVKISEPFKFAGFGIEFTNGFGIYNNAAYIPFALQDGFSFMLSVSMDFLLYTIFEGFEFTDTFSNMKGDSTLIKFFNNTKDSYACIAMAQEYYSKGHFSAAVQLSERACEYDTFNSFDDLYEAIFICGKAMSQLPKTDEHEKSLWLRMIDLLPNRSEGYLMLSKYYFYREIYQDSYTFAKLAYNKNYYKFDKNILGTIDGDIQYAKCLYFTEHYQEVDNILNQIMSETILSKQQLYEVNEFLQYVQNNKKNRYRVL